MSDAVPFTDNYRDLSNRDGYQFEFRCERCGNGYRSAFKRSLKQTGSKILGGIGGVLSGKARQYAGQAERMLNRSTNSTEKDNALRAAVAEISPQFTQCRGCGDWVCEAVCWNPQVGQCVRCSPSVSEELPQLQAQARRQQMREQLRSTPLTGGIDLGSPAVARCPHCQAPSAGGKFCSACGMQLSAVRACGSCHAENGPDALFCAQCGTGLI